MRRPFVVDASLIAADANKQRSAGSADFDWRPWPERPDHRYWTAAAGCVHQQLVPETASAQAVYSEW